jgi:aldehyde dehydrogenase (NAD+)
MAVSSIINGKLHHGNDIFKSLNPSTPTEVIGEFASAGREECLLACNTAKEAFGHWKNVPAPFRGELVNNLGKLIFQNKEAFSRIVSKEMGKPLKEARGDVQEAVDTCVFFASEGRRLYGQTVPSEMPSKELFTYRKPLGVFACITAGNFPVAVPAWYFVPALLAGNTCVWKPSEDTPRISQFFTELVHAAGFPKNVFNTVFGLGSKTGKDLIELVKEGHIQKVGFTGSTEVGSGIGEICGRFLQHPCLELGGKNPLVVTPSAHLDLAVTGALWSAFGTAGQRCTSLGNLILHTSIKEKFVSLFMKKVNELKIGDPFDPSVFYGPLISKKFADNHVNHLSTLVKKKHTLLTSKNGMMESEKDWASFVGKHNGGYYAFPSVVDGVDLDDEIYRTETFGPLINIMTYSDMKTAIEYSNQTGFGLSSSIYSNDPNEIFMFKNEISAGMTSINNGTSGAEAHLPFGGNGKSGNGSRQSGIWVLDQFTKWQAVNWDYSGQLQLAQIDTPSAPNLEYVLPSEG